MSDDRSSPKRFYQSSEGSANEFDCRCCVLATICGALCATFYREQLLSWEECEPKVAQYCQRMALPMTADSFVEHLRTKLSEVAAEVDRTPKANQELMINERGE